MEMHSRLRIGTADRLLPQETGRAGGVTIASWPLVPDPSADRAYRAAEVDTDSLLILW